MYTIDLRPEKGVVIDPYLEDSISKQIRLRLGKFESALNAQDAIVIAKFPKPDEFEISFENVSPELMKQLTEDFYSNR